MDRERIGQLPPRYAFLLNEHADTRLSRCPECRKPTHSRKFVLFIHAEPRGPLALRKTCRYCSRCELIIAHRDELSAELARAVGVESPEEAELDFLVLGTVDRKVWKEGRAGKEPTLDEVLRHVADFVGHHTLDYDPGGWVQSGRGRSDRRCPND